VPGWTTCTVATGIPDEFVMVTVAVRAVVAVFAWADSPSDPLVVPDAGETVSHDWFDDADQETDDHTDVDIADADALGTIHCDIPRLNAGAALALAWVTVTVCVDAGPEVVVNVNVAVRAAPLLPTAYTYTALLPVPDVGAVVNHAGFDDVTVHAWVVVSCMYVPVLEFQGISHEDMSTDSPEPDCAPGWVTDTDTVTCGVPEVVWNVMVAVRNEGDVFAVAVNITDPFPFPVAGESVSHDWFEDADQVVDEVTCVDTDAPLADGTAHEDNPTVSVGPLAPAGCVTATVLVTCGLPEVVVNVMVAVRDDAVVFAAAFKVTDPLPLPVAGETVAHAWFDDADHVVFDDTCAATCAALADGTAHDVLSTVNTGAVVVPAWFTVTVHVT